MKLWFRRLAVIALLGGWIALTAWVLLLELFLSSFMPNLLLQLLLPVVLAVLGIALWRVALVLNRQGPQ